MTFFMQEKNAEKIGIIGVKVMGSAAAIIVFWGRKANGNMEFANRIRDIMNTLQYCHRAKMNK